MEEGALKVEFEFGRLNVGVPAPLVGTVGFCKGIEGVTKGEPDMDRD